jgi:hypothetical protein
MLSLDAPIENIGDAKGRKEIVVNNKEKWRFKLFPKIVEKIEGVCVHSLKQYGYSYGYIGDKIVLSKIELIFY